MHLNKVAIIYISYTNNTKLLAESIGKYLTNSVKVDVFEFNDTFDLNEYDFVFLGSFSWGNGNIPIKFRKYLKRILIEEPVKTKYFSVFGTGDTQWGDYYCKAVDEIEYHLQKHNKIVIGKLKMEQKPISKYKQDIIKNYVEDIRKEVDRLNDRND